MEVFHPRAKRVKGSRAAGRFIGVPTKVVIHTTEGTSYDQSTDSYFGGSFWPHATIFGATIFQHYPIDVAVFALEHEPGVFPDTNNANAIQCEVVHRCEAVDARGRPRGVPTPPEDWTDETLRTLADWISWVCKQTGTPIRFAEMYRTGLRVGDLATTTSTLRFAGQDWLDFNGICGHSTVPDNAHWDPGRLPVERLRPLLTGDVPRLVSEEIQDMFIADIDGLEHPQLIGAGWRKSIRSGKTAEALLNAGVKHLGRLDRQVGSDLIDIESVPTALAGIAAAVKV